MALGPYKSLGDTPKPVDYAMVGVPANSVVDVIEKGTGNVRFAHIIAAGFGEEDSRGSPTTFEACYSRKASADKYSRAKL